VFSLRSHVSPRVTTTGGILAAGLRHESGVVAVRATRLCGCKGIGQRGTRTRSAGTSTGDFLVVRIGEGDFATLSNRLTCNLGAPSGQNEGWEVEHDSGSGAERVVVA
jgi:hypothetical protein